MTCFSIQSDSDLSVDMKYLSRSDEVSCIEESHIGPLNISSAESISPRRSNHSWLTLAEKEEIQSLSETLAAYKFPSDTAESTHCEKPRKASHLEAEISYFEVKNTTREETVEYFTNFKKDNDRSGNLRSLYTNNPTANYTREMFYSLFGITNQ